ncbi:unnamed protein product [Lepeophtheirus salmonis]|uniref:(salmon louse) hypothetical protein n=1 Tax=Lepeophtheirus salmonis TaxID=72036 RepID=A0A7R8H4Z0_LEPSM|nr:unnamed protein product [Lepeophtheirus salmonis]CAF2871622.1 unnamed protein product [Lepeophtheirus salmonis]
MYKNLLTRTIFDCPQFNGASSELGAPTHKWHLLIPLGGMKHDPHWIRLLPSTSSCINAYPILRKCDATAIQNGTHGSRSVKMVFKLMDLLTGPSSIFRAKFPTFSKFEQLRNLQRVNVGLENEIEELETLERLFGTFVRGNINYEEDSESSVNDNEENHGVITRSKSYEHGLSLVTPFRFYSCLKCSEGFYTIRSLREHYKNCHNICFGNNISFSSPDLSINEYGRTYFCWKFFAKKSFLKSNIVNLNKIKPSEFVCYYFHFFVNMP